jgi:hypothetical protein
MSKKTPENAVKKSIKDLLDWLHIFNFPVLQGLGCQPGICDRIAIHNGRFVAIEIKGPKGVISPMQRDFLEKVEKAGGLSIIAKSPDDVIKALGVGDRFLGL